MKTSDTFKKVIKSYLDKKAKDDGLFAAQYCKQDKSLEKCYDFIINEVKKSGRNGFDDDEIFGLAIHYYQEDDIKDIKKIPNCHIVVNLSDQTKENLEREAELEYKAQKLAELKAKDAKILENKKRKAEAAKRKDEETGQLSLF